MNSEGGIGFLGLLTIVFIVLKLVGTITWSWWWVLAPLWIPPAIVIGFVVLVFGFTFFIILIALMFSGENSARMIINDSINNFNSGFKKVWNKRRHGKY